MSKKKDILFMSRFSLLFLGIAANYFMLNLITRNISAKYLGFLSLAILFIYTIPTFRFSKKYPKDCYYNPFFNGLEMHINDAVEKELKEKNIDLKDDTQKELLFYKHAAIRILFAKEKNLNVAFITVHVKAKTLKKTFEDAIEIIEINNFDRLYNFFIINLLSKFIKKYRITNTKKGFVKCIVYTEKFSERTLKNLNRRSSYEFDKSIKSVI